VAATSVSFQAWREETADCVYHRYCTLHVHSYGEIVLFQHIISNEGNGFNNVTGVFRVPDSGTYAFFVSLVTNGAVGLSVDNSIVSAYYTTVPGNFTAGTLHATMPLRHGQTVSVRSVKDGTVIYHSAPFEFVFSGVLVRVSEPWWPQGSSRM
ncbi:hypothetical protein BaRGS_00007365, partial [Batillaria attramentaria]